MSRVKLKTLREMNDNDLSDKLFEMNTELAKMRSEGAKGTLKKQTGNIKWLRRDIARIMTLQIERKNRSS